MSDRSFRWFVLGCLCLVVAGSAAGAQTGDAEGWVLARVDSAAGDRPDEITIDVDRVAYRRLQRGVVPSCGSFRYPVVSPSTWICARSSC